MDIPFVSAIIDFLLTLIDSMGYFGIFILMTIESSIVPFPAELILIPAGALVALDRFHWVGVLFASVLGSVAGALFNYVLAYYLGRKTVNYLVHKYGKFFFLNEEHLMNTEKFFDKHGPITTFVGRLIPGLRSFVSLPPGFAKMKLWSFCLYTALGAGIWNAVLISLGYIFGSNLDLINRYLGYLTVGVLILVVIVVSGYLTKTKYNKKKAQNK